MGWRSENPKIKGIIDNLGDAVVYVSKNAEVKDKKYNQYRVCSIAMHDNPNTFFGKKQAILSKFIQPWRMKNDDLRLNRHQILIYYLLLIHVRVFSVMDRAQKHKKMLHEIVDDLEISIGINYVYKGEFIIQNATEIKKERVFFELLMEDIYSLAQWRVLKKTTFSKLVEKMMITQSRIIDRIKSSKKSIQEIYKFDETIFEEGNYTYIVENVKKYSQEDFFMIIDCIVQLFHFEMSKDSKEKLSNDREFLSEVGVPNVDKQFNEVFFEELTQKNGLLDDRIIELRDFLSVFSKVESFYEIESKKYKVKISELYAIK